MPRTYRVGALGALLSTLMVVSLASSTLAVSPIIDVGQQKGRSADAWTGDCVDDVPEQGDYTCQFQNAWVFTGWSRFNGERSREPRACVSGGTEWYDSSEGIYYSSYEYGCADGGTASVARDLSSASGSGTAETTAEECFYNENTDEGDCQIVGTGAVAFDVEWTGDGPVSRGTYRYTDRFEDCRLSDAGRGKSRAGTAAGTIDGQDVSFDEAYLNDGSYKFTYMCTH